MDSPSLNVLSLCTGGGGLDLGIRLACRAARAVCYVEIESFACEVLASRMAEGRMDAAPVWTNLRSFDGRPWRGVVDLVAGGFPCTDISNAGKRAGIEGEHSSLWFEFARVIREVGPGLVFLENVPPLLVRGLDRVLGDLAGLGFDAEWDLFSAAEVGAPHLRERFFLLARHVSDTGRDLLRLLAERDKRTGGGKREAKRGDAELGDVGQEGVGDSDRQLLEGRGAAGQPRQAGSSTRHQEVADANGRRLAIVGASHDDAEACDCGHGREDHYGGVDDCVACSCTYFLAVADSVRGRLAARRELLAREPDAQRSCDDAGARPERPGLLAQGSVPGRRKDVLADARGAGPASDAPLWPPGPDDQEGWREFLERVPGAQPALRRGAHGLADRVDRLRLLGNGVVPQVAALALRTLARRLTR